MKLAYCDYIAFLIATELKSLDTNGQRLLSSVDKVRFDVGHHNEFLSTTKTIDVEDRFGKQYRVTVQEL